MAIGERSAGEPGAYAVPADGTTVHIRAARQEDDAPATGVRARVQAAEPADAFLRRLG